MESIVNKSHIKEKTEEYDSRESIADCLTEKRGMERFLSPATLEMIKKNRGEEFINLEGELRNVVIMFTDIRGFTSYSEENSPEKVFKTLNSYIELQSEVIIRHNGIIDKFLGDGIMIIFEGNSMIHNAMNAACQIQYMVSVWNQKRNLDDALKVGIGLTKGEVLMGSMGSKDRMEYTAIGDNVNIASRLCSHADGGEIIFTEHVNNLFPLLKEIRFKETLKVKGKKKKLTLYHIPPNTCYPLKLN